MKKLFLLLFGLLLALPAFPRSFQYEYEGQTITYSVIDEDARTVRTTMGSYDGFGNPIAGSQVSGTLILPANPKDGEKTYTLTTISNRSFSNCSLLDYVSIPYSYDLSKFFYDKIG